MKWLITLLVLTLVAFAVDPIDKLENSYIVKAEAIEIEKQAALKACDDKFTGLITRLNKIYLSSLKKKLISEKKNGNFDGAVEADKLIKQYIETGKVSSEAPKTASLKKLFDAYNAKKSEIEESVNKTSIETMYAGKSRKLAQSYIFSLKKVLKLETKTGTLESAKAINDKIKEMENILKGQTTRPEVKVIIAPITTADRFIGKWRRTKNPKAIYTFDKSGVVTLPVPGHRGTWKVSSPTSITITWSHRSNKDIHVLSADGKSLIWNGGIDSTRITIDPIVGEWKWLDERNVILLVDGTATSSEGSTVTWETSGLNKYSVTWKKGNSTLIDYLLLSPDGTMLSGKNNRGRKIWASKVKPKTTKPKITKPRVIKPITKKVKLHPHWQAAKNNNKYTLHLLEDNTCLFTVNGSESATGKWTISNGVVSVKWNNGAKNTYKISGKKIVDNFGSTWTPLSKLSIYKGKYKLTFDRGNATVIVIEITDDNVYWLSVVDRGKTTHNHKKLVGHKFEGDYLRVQHGDTKYDYLNFKLMTVIHTHKPDISGDPLTGHIHVIIESIGNKLNNRVYHWSSTQRILFQTGGKTLKASRTGAFKPAGTWKEISPGVIQWSIYKFHFSADLSYYNIEKDGKKYDQKIPFLSVRDK